MNIEGLPPICWLASYKKETKDFHPHTKCILCDKVEKTILLKCTCIVGTPTCNPCCQKYLLNRGKLFNLHREKLLEHMNSAVGGPVIPLPRKAKTQPTPEIRKRAEAWFNPKNTNIRDIIGLALKQYNKEKSAEGQQTTNLTATTDNTRKTNPKQPPKDETITMIEVSTLSETTKGNLKPHPMTIKSLR